MIVEERLQMLLFGIMEAFLNGVGLMVGLLLILLHCLVLAIFLRRLGCWFVVVVSGSDIAALPYSVDLLFKFSSFLKSLRRPVILGTRGILVCPTCRSSFFFEN